jgi:hypothetical protein
MFPRGEGGSLFLGSAGNDLNFPPLWISPIIPVRPKFSSDLYAAPNLSTYFILVPA